MPNGIMADGLRADYITYYNSRRVQRGLGVLTPMEKYLLAAKQNLRKWMNCPGVS